MALEQEFQTARKNGYQGTRIQFKKLRAINCLEWAEVYLTSAINDTSFDDKKTMDDIRKEKQKLRKLIKKIQELEV